MNPFDHRDLAVEDSLPGVESARAAGIDVVAVHDRHSDPDRAAIDALALLTYSDIGAIADGASFC